MLPYYKNLDHTVLQRHFNMPPGGWVSEQRKVGLRHPQRDKSLIR